MTTPTKKEVLAAIETLRAAAEPFLAQEPEPEPVDPLLPIAREVLASDGWWEERAEKSLGVPLGNVSTNDALAGKWDDHAVTNLIIAALRRGMELRPQITREMVRECLRACHWRTDDWAVETFHAALTAQVQHD